MERDLIKNKSGPKREEERKAEEEQEIIYSFYNFLWDQLEISQTKANEAAMEKVVRHLREMFDETGEPPESASLRKFLGYNDDKEQKE